MDKWDEIKIKKGNESLEILKSWGRVVVESKDVFQEAEWEREKGNTKPLKSLFS